MRTERLRQAYEVEVKWRHFPLHPDTPAEGLALADLFAGRTAYLEAAHARLNRLFAEEGLPVGERTMTFNTRLAQELAAWAGTQPGGDAIHAALFRAVFVEQRNIAEAAVLLELAAQVGLPKAEAATVLSTHSFAAAVDADWREAAELGITGVPTFVAANQGVVGAQPYEVLEQLVRAAGAKPR